MGEIVVKENAQTPEGANKPKQKKIWWRVLLAFLGGFLTFPALVAGGAAIVGTVLTTKQVVSMAGGNPDEILGEKYQDLTMLQAIMQLANSDFNTLEDLNEVTPLVQSTVEGVLDDIFGQLSPDGTSPITWDDIKDSNFLSASDSSKTGSDLADKILDTLTLSSILDDGSLKGVFLYFLYPIAVDENGNNVLDDDGHVVFDKDNPYTISYFMEHGAQAFNSVIDNIVIGDVVEPGDNQLLNAMKNWQLSEMSKKINTLTIEDIFSAKQLSDSKLLTAIKAWSIGDFGTNDQIDVLKVDDLFDVSGAGALMNTIADFYIGNLRGYEIIVDKDGKLDTRGKPGSFDIVDHIYLKDILEEDMYIEFKDDKADDYKTRHDKYNPVLGAIMENERKDRYEEAHEKGYTKEYEDWLKEGDNADYLANIDTLTNPDLLDNIYLKDIMDIEEGSVLYSFRDKKISELSDLDTNSFKLADLLEKDVYVEFTDDKADDYKTRHDKYNKVIGAIMENERKDRYAEAKKVAEKADESISSYNDWLEEDDNGEYKATVSTLTDPDCVNNIKISEIIDTEGTLLNSFADKTIGTLNEVTMDDIFLRDLFEEDVYIEFTDSSDKDYKTKHGKYNRVVGALMENERKDRYEEAKEKGYTKEYEDWLKEDDNGEYKATARLLSDQSAIDKLKLSDVIDTSTLAKGTTIYNLIHTLDEDPEANIGNLADKLGSISLGNLFGVPKDSEGKFKNYSDWSSKEKENNPYVLYSLRDTSLNGMSAALNELTIEQAINITEDSPKILKTLSSKTLNSLSEEMKKLTLRDVMDVYDEDVYKKDDEGNYLDEDGNITTKESEYVRLHEKSSPIILSLADVKILNGTELAKKLDGLMIKDVLTEEDCASSNVLAALWRDNDRGAVKITEIGSKINKVKITDVLGDDLYDGTGGDKDTKTISYTWWFMLTEENEYEGWKATTEGQARIDARQELGNGKDYTIQDFSKLVDNMSYHMSHEKMGVLYDAGVLNLTDGSILDKTLGGREVRDYTIPEFVDFINTYIAYLPS